MPVTFLEPCDFHDHGITDGILELADKNGLYGQSDISPIDCHLN